MKINTYINFNGNCSEAFNFYQSVFGKALTSVSTYKDLPPSNEMSVPAEYNDKILHIALPLTTDFVLMGCDYVEGFGAPLQQGNNFSIFLSVDSRREADSVFNSLAQGGQITMPMGMTFWNSWFGMLSDRFGINWMISCENLADSNLSQTEAEQFFCSFERKHDGVVSGQMFGKSCLKANGKAFACLFENEMVFKLPKEAVIDVLKLDAVRLFDPSGKNCPMKEWVQVPVTHKNIWEELAAKAVEFSSK